jgi:hypothetical protein
MERQTDPMDRQHFAVGNLSPPHHSQFGRGSAPALGDFPIHQDIFVGGGDRSVRRKYPDE